MEMSPELSSLLTSPSFLSLAVVTFFMYVLAVGLAMKMALACMAPEAPSLLRATYISFMIPFVQFVLGIVLMSFIPIQFGLPVKLLLLYVSLKMLAVMADISVGWAFLTNIVYGFFGLITVGTVMACSGGAFYVAIYKPHPQEMSELGAMMKTHVAAMEKEQKDRLLGRDTPSDTDFDITNVFFSDRKKDKKDSSVSKTRTSEPSDASVSTPTPFTSIPVSPAPFSSAQNDVPEKKLPQEGIPQNAVEPSHMMPLQIRPLMDTRNQQTNPFVK
ncbi:hypothetical protein Pla22_43340 [Rubripirellula amarantea]|uniref:Uncharacterized protein n=1 Tax=Rubripirellula amarantea TaxID=2527999 RepID=A0A5C5WH71_9BACT|nr:hypothetical protein [Rubripirellula amarantea]TWT49142.1 hypothetical protein Pla22_43340 [Rubripirellula amarantea]